MTSTTRSAKNALIRRARERGFRIDARKRTIYVEGTERTSHRSVERLICEFGFVLQVQDSCFGCIDSARFFISLPVGCADPSTHDTYDFNRQRSMALRVENFLMKQGYRCYNQFKGLSDDTPAFLHARASVSALSQCNAIVLMPGWTVSPKCRREFELACEMNLRIYTLDKAFKLTELH